MAAGRDHQRSEGFGPARARRRGFSTGMKWSFVPKQSREPKYVLCNGDESEPGTCKDRLIFEHDPHAVIEGVMIAALAVGSQTGYIYIRGEYRYLSSIMQKAIKRRVRKRLPRQEYFRQRQRSGHLLARRRGRLRSRRRVGADGVARRQARHPAHPASLPCCGRALGRADRHQQCRDAGQRAAHHAWRADWYRRSGHAEKRRHAPVLPERTI